MDKKTRIFLNILSSNDAPTSTYDQYPTTPSTFPQPVFQPASGQPAVDMEFPNHPTQQLSSNGFVPSDYFMQNYHLPEYPAQSRPHADSGNDPSAALVHQFSNQILGIDSGSYAFGLRAPLLTRSSGQAVPAMEHHIAAPANKRTPAVPGLFAQVPEPNPDKYGQNANNNQKKCCQQATAFFKDSVKRARERNQR